MVRNVYFLLHFKLLIIVCTFDCNNFSFSAMYNIDINIFESSAHFTVPELDTVCLESSFVDRNVYTGDDGWTALVGDGYFWQIHVDSTTYYSYIFSDGWVRRYGSVSGWGECDVRQLNSLAKFWLQRVRKKRMAPQQIRLYSCVPFRVLVFLAGLLFSVNRFVDVISLSIQLCQCIFRFMSMLCGSVLGCVIFTVYYAWPGVALFAFISVCVVTGTIFELIGIAFSAEFGFCLIY